MKKCFLTIYIFLSYISPLFAQFPPDSINNWKVNVNESNSSAEFFGFIEFDKDSSIALFTQAIDISSFNLNDSFYAYYSAGDSDTKIWALFQGSGDPGLYDSTFHAETDSTFFDSLLTDQDLSVLANYNTPGGDFNKSFGLKYIRLKINGTNQNSKAATVRWSFVLPKKLNAKTSQAFKIKDTRL